MRGVAAVVGLGDVDLDSDGRAVADCDVVLGLCDLRCNGARDGVEVPETGEVGGAAVADAGD